MKSINESAVLKLVRDYGPISRSDLVRITELTAPTISNILDALASQGVIHPVGLGLSRGGRKPLMFQFNPDAALVVGVDVGGTKMAGGLANLAGRSVARKTVTVETGPSDSYKRLVDLIESLLAEADPGDQIRGIGLGVAGVTNLSEGIVTLSPGLDWSNFPLGPQLERHFGLPVYLDNDVNTILLGERWFGAARESNHVLCVAIGTGIGASLLLGGHIYRGANEAAGEVGYFATDRTALQHPSFSRNTYGFLEEQAAGPGIGRRGTMIFGRPMAAPEVMRMAAAGDPRAVAIVNETVQHIGLAIANMVLLVNPEMVILTGGVMRSADLLLPGISEIITRLVPYPPQVVLSELKEEAGVLGAVSLVLEADRRSIKVEA